MATMEGEWKNAGVLLHAKDDCSCTAMSVAQGMDVIIRSSRGSVSMVLVEQFVPGTDDNPWYRMAEHRLSATQPGVRFDTWSSESGAVKPAPVTADEWFLSPDILRRLETTWQRAGV